MEALDRYTFEQWQEEHQQYLDAKFTSVCNKLDNLKAQRVEDREYCDKTRATCQGHLSTELEEIKEKGRKTTKLLAAGIVLSALVCLTITGHFPIVGLVKAAIAFVF